MYKMTQTIVPNSSEGIGNTQLTIPSPSDPSKTQVSKRVHHFFTFNNYDRSEDINMLKLIFEEYCYMYAFQEEKGENGTPHLQGVISCHKKMRDTEFGLPKKIHWERVINITKSYIYCTKKETRVGDVFTKNYKLPYEFEIKEYRGWQQMINKKLLKEPNNRTVMWYWSEEGNLGKSYFVKDYVMNKNAVFLSKGKYSDIINVIYKTDMTLKRIVMIDLPRNNGNGVSYDAIESIKNGLICNTKFETGFIAFPPPHVLVFANSPPDEEKLSGDRWDINYIEEE